MKAAYFEQSGGPEVLTYGEVPDPEVGPDTVLVRVQAVSIEGGDVISRRIGQPASPRHVVGYQAGGVVEAVGPAVTRFAPGDRVAAFNPFGSHAELFAVPEGHCFAVPEGVAMDVAATVPITFGTAHDALFEFGRLKAGETVLIQGAAGGVGVACVQLARRAGATVIGTAHGEDRLERLRALGLDHGIDYAREDIGVRTRELTGGRGADLVVDMAGGKSLAQLFDALAYRGRIAAIGGSSGTFPTFSFRDLLSKNVTVVGVYLALEIATPRIHEAIAGYYARIAAGELTMPIDRAFPLAEAAAAHAHIEQGHPFGRVLLHP